MAIFPKRTILVAIVSLSVICHAFDLDDIIDWLLGDHDYQFSIDDIGDWFRDLATEAPETIVKCVINDVEQVIDMAHTLHEITGDCGLELFALLESSTSSDSIISRKNGLAFVFNTIDPAEIAQVLKCVDGKIDENNVRNALEVAGTTYEVAKGIKKSNVVSYVAFCLLEEIVDDFIDESGDGDGGEGEGGDGGGEGCFDSSTSVCRISDEHMQRDMAFEQCFTDKKGIFHGGAELVPMSELVPGDLVLSRTKDDILFTDRIVVIQHHGKTNPEKATLTQIHHSGSGSISLTPNHLLLANGEYQPASQVPIDSVLPGNLIVKEKVTHDTAREIINPVTVSGTILAAGEGIPVLATTVTDTWKGKIYLLSNSYKTVAASMLLAKLFPLSFQDFYDRTVEPAWCLLHPYLRPMRTKTEAHRFMILLILIVCDVATAGAFTVFLVFSNLYVLIALLAILWFISRLVSTSTST